MARTHLCDRCQIDRGILADRRMRAAPCLDPYNPVLWQDLHAHQRFCVLLSVDVIGNHTDRKIGLQRAGKAGGKRGFAGTDLTCDQSQRRARHDTVFENGKRTAVSFGPIQKVRVGQQCKRPLSQSVMMCIKLCAHCITSLLLWPAH